MSFRKNESRRLNDKLRMTIVCNPKEIHTYLSMSNNKYLKSCFRKIPLQQFDLNGNECY